MTTQVSKNSQNQKRVPNYFGKFQNANFDYNLPYFAEFTTFVYKIRLKNKKLGGCTNIMVKYWKITLFCVNSGQNCIYKKLYISLA